MVVPPAVDVVVILIRWRFLSRTPRCPREGPHLTDAGYQPSKCIVRYGTCCGGRCPHAKGDRWKSRAPHEGGQVSTGALIAITVAMIIGPVLAQLVEAGQWTHRKPNRS